MTIKARSSKGQHFIIMYNRARAVSLSEFYKTYSAEKGRAERAIKEEMAEYNINVVAKAQMRKAIDYRILGGNCMTYTAGYRIIQDGLTVAWVIHTAYNKYVIE